MFAGKICKAIEKRLILNFVFIFDVLAEMKHIVHLLSQTDGILSFGKLHIVLQKVNALRTHKAVIVRL